MITKILFTLAVIVGVLMFYRYKNQRTRSNIAVKTTPASTHNSKLGKIVAYSFVGVLILISAGWYGLHWKEQHRVITIRVIGEGETMNYKAYKKDYKDSRFETLDGRTVILGDSERVEIIDYQ